MTTALLPRLIGTFFFVGYLKPAPGTWGSLAAVIVAVPLIFYGGLTALLLGIIVSFAAGLWATTAMTSEGPHDPSEIVIDEVAGQWVALLPFAFINEMFRNQTPEMSVETLIGWIPGLLLAFGFFRLFDIWKPWPVSWADRREDAMGVMLDDILAGILAAAATLGAVYVLSVIVP